MKNRIWPVAALLVLGIGWGATQPLGKIAAETGHGHFGLIFWQSLIASAVLGLIVMARGGKLSLQASVLRFSTLIAMVGTIVPNSTFYISVAHLPAGVMSVIISLIPLVALPVAVAMGMDRFSPPRIGGLLCGAIGVLLIALPRTSLPDPSMVWWLPVAMVGPVCYAVEASIITRWGTAGQQPIEAMFGVCMMAAVISLPLMLVTGQWFPIVPLGAPEIALVLTATLQGIIYSGYFALAQRTGPVFASQTSYVVTAAGMGWAMLLLGERFSLWIWAALPFLLLGLFLVRPKPRPAQAA